MAETDAPKRRRRSYDKIFFWIIFFLIPLFLTLLYLRGHNDLLSELLDFGTPTPWLALLTVVAACSSFYLLDKHWPVR